LCCINLETQKLLYKYDAKGVILTDIAFANDCIFFPSVQTKSSEFHCLDSETGQLIWKTEVPMLSFKSSLCVSNDKLYAIGFRFGKNISALLAINAKSGDIEEILPFSRFEDATFERYPGPICLADGILVSTFSGEVIYRQGSAIKWAVPHF
jgi:outer membrane protein assembly factor BamB